MPTTKEIVSNRPLAGSELAKIILRDVARMMESNSLLSSQMAYSRIAYDLRLQLHLDLPSLPLSEDHARSRPPSSDEPPSGIESFPLADAPHAIHSATDLSRDIQSPNAERLRHGLPVTVETLGPDGHHREDQVEYPADHPALASVLTPDPEPVDSTAAARKEEGIADPLPRPTPPPPPKGKRK